MNQQNKNSRIKILTLHNLTCPAGFPNFEQSVTRLRKELKICGIINYATQVLERDRQNGFTQHLALRVVTGVRQRRTAAKLSTGFIPMIIFLVLVIGIAVWIVFTRVLHAHK